MKLNMQSQYISKSLLFTWILFVFYHSTSFAQVCIVDYKIVKTEETLTLVNVYDYEAPWGLQTSYSCKRGLQDVVTRHYSQPDFISEGGKENGVYKKGCDALCKALLKNFNTHNPKPRGYREKTVSMVETQKLLAREIQANVGCMDLANKKAQIREWSSLSKKWSEQCVAQ